MPQRAMTVNLLPTCQIRLNLENMIQDRNRERDALSSMADAVARPVVLHDRSVVTPISRGCLIVDLQA